MPPLPQPCLAAFEVYSFSGALRVLDAVEKAARVEIYSIELNDNYGLYLELGGDASSVARAEQSARIAAKQAGLDLQAAAAFSGPPRQLAPLIFAPDEYNALIEQNVTLSLINKPTMAKQPNLALGFIETRGFTAVTAAVDAAAKAADVEIIAKEKLGGGFITIVLEGNVAAAKAAIEAATMAAQEIGEVIASNVIARPSEGVRKILSNL